MAIRISKFLSLVLRHDPERIGIVLDDAGWTDVTALLAATAAHGVTITRDALAQVVATSDKQRFALSPDGTRIRANQGHSVEVELGLPPTPPPATLYHGTVEAALPGIRDKGLVRGARHHVHLSPDLETATKVGTRRGAPVILTIRADAMADAGHVFYRSQNGVWLVDHVPVEFIVFEGRSPGGSGTRGAHPKGTCSPGGSLAKSAMARDTLAVCDAGEYKNAAGETVNVGAEIAAAKSGTLLHEIGRIAIAEQTLAAGDGRARTTFAVTGESTIEALVRLSHPKGTGSPGGSLAKQPGGHLACLNFASAKNPGGGFLGGAQAQEESLARSSALYPCQLTQRAHYDRNRANHSAIYLDLAIYSPLVPVFRDDHGGWLDRPVLASMITCAAPNAGALRQQGKFDAKLVEDRLRKRAAFVLAIAAHHRVERFVLGAWGAGVFGNDPEMVADAFGVLLEGEYANVFPEVVFAVHGRPGANYDAFAKRFGA